MSEFRSLKIERETYGPHKGQLVATIDLRGERGNVTLKLNSDLAAKLLSVAKAALIDSVEETANDFIFELTTEIPEAPLLSEPKEDA